MNWFKRFKHNKKNEEEIFNFKDIFDEFCKYGLIYTTKNCKHEVYYQCNNYDEAYIYKDDTKSSGYKNCNLWFEDDDLKEIIKLQKALEILLKEAESVRNNFGCDLYADHLSKNRKAIVANLLNKLQDLVIKIREVLLNNCKNIAELNSKYSNENIKADCDCKKYDDLINQVLNS